MTKTLQKIVFFGTEDFSASSLLALINAGYNVQLVVTKPDSQKGRGRKISVPAVKEIAKKHDIQVLQPKKLEDVTENIKALGDVAGVLVSYGKIIPQTILDLFNPGIINVHPSLLPKYRGPSPIESVIFNGDHQTGVSIMQVTKDMDAGPVYYQETVELRGDEDRPELYKTLAAIGGIELTNVLDDILQGTLQPTPQDNAKATYCHMLTKKQSYLAPSTMTAQEMERHIRAFLGYPKSRCMLLGHEVIVTKAHIADSVSHTLPQLTGKDGSLLSIDELVAPSGKTMSGEAFLRGYSKA